MLKKDLTKIYDSHTHFNDETYEQNGITTKHIIEEAEQNGVGYFNNVAFSLKSSINAIEQVKPFDNAFALIGIHPNEIHNHKINKDILELEKLIKDSKVVGIGEVGLDYWNCKTDKEEQKQWFIAQIRLAKKYNLPLMMHIRDDRGVFNSYDDAIEILKKEKPETMIVHCFSGNLKYAKKFLELGAYIEIGGAVTFKNAKELQEAVVSVPLEKMLVETDAPYLTPHPFRGKMNFSKFIVLTVEQIAKLKNVEKTDVIEKTTQNAFKIFLKR